MTPSLERLALARLQERFPSLQRYGFGRTLRSIFPDIQPEEVAISKPRTKRARLPLSIGNQALSNPRVGGAKNVNTVTDTPPIVIDGLPKRPRGRQQ